MLVMPSKPVEKISTRPETDADGPVNSPLAMRVPASRSDSRGARSTGAEDAVAAVVLPADGGGSIRFGAGGGGAAGDNGEKPHGECDHSSSPGAPHRLRA